VVVSSPASKQNAPDANALIAAHAAEIERLPSLVASGVVEVRWRDEDGSHFEQGDLDLRFRSPSDLSLRISKLGETQLMGGCNAQRWWWFEGWSKPTSMAIGARGSAAPRANAQRPPPIGAEELLAILGLRAFESVEASAASTAGESAGTWVVDLPSSRSPFRLPTRLTFDRAQASGAVGWSLVKIEAIDGDGEVVISARFDAHRRIERRAAPTGDWPVIATSIRLTGQPRDGRRGFEWLILLDRPSATGERIVDRLFDPAAIETSLRPEFVEVDGEVRGRR